MHSQSEPSQPDLFYARNESEIESTSSESTKVPNNLHSLQSTLNANIEKLRQEISAPVHKKQISYGIWDDELKLVKLVDHKNLKQYPPHFLNNCAYLHPFEALFCLECRSLAISHENIPLSIEDGHKLLLKDKRDHKLYRVFSTLSKNGYHVRECQETFEDDSMSETNSQQSTNANEKHLIENIDIHQSEHRKKLKVELLNPKEQTNDNNYKVMTSIRPLSMGHFRKLSKIDKKLQSKCCESDKSSKSILYSLRDSAVPVELNKHLTPLWGHDLRPLVDLSAIHDTERLFELMQRAGPKCGATLSSSAQACIPPEMKIAFEVYRNKADVTSSVPLFGVVLINLNDPLPSSSILRRLQSSGPSPLFFALVSDSLEFNFYGLENIIIEREYPTLWEKYYA